MHDHTFGECPICGQGTLVAMKDANSGELLIICDDCESQWRSPEDAQSYEKALPNEFYPIEKASREELKRKGWIA